MSIRMKILPALLPVGLVFSGMQARAQTKQVYTIDPSKIVHAVDNRIYSQFLEHIFNSVHGGLWGDMILNGGFVTNRLPTPEETSLVPPYWNNYGTAGYCAFDRDDSPSGNGCTIINCAGGGKHYSLFQGPLNLVAGETYKGRIYMKSPDGVGVDIKILPQRDPATGKLQPADALKWLPSALYSVAKVGPDWNAYDFDFKSGITSDSACVFVMLNGTGAVKVSNFTLFSETALDNGGFRPDILKAIKNIKPATIRYPGGCFASGYHWKDAIGPAEKRKYYPGVIWSDRDPNQMGTDEFMRLCEKVGAEPILAINKGLGVQETLDWMEYCNGPITSKWGRLRAENGHPKPYNVKYWEIDNEVWGMQPEDYAKDIKTFSEALKGKDPNAIIIACGSYAYDTGVGEGGKKDWNKRLIDNAAPYFDFLSIHYYNGICVDQDYVQDPRKFEAFMRDDIGAIIKDSKNPKIRIYCSEWGMTNPEWRGGLYTAAILNAFERQSDLVQMSCPAVWLQRISVDKPNPRWASCQILYDHKTFVPAPEYVAMKLWRDNLGANLVKMAGPAEPLNAAATLSADKKTLYFKVVNPTKDMAEVELKLSKGVAKSAALTIINPGDENARNTLADTGKVRPEAGTATANGGIVSFKMPALSAGVVAVKLK